MVTPVRVDKRCNGQQTLAGGTVTFGLPQGGPDAIDHRDDKQNIDQRDDPAQPNWQGRADPDPQPERPEDEGAIALAERSVVAARGADRGAEHAGEFRE